MKFIYNFSALFAHNRTGRNGVCSGCGKTQHSNSGRCIWFTLTASNQNERVNGVQWTVSQYCL